MRNQCSIIYNTCDKYECLWDGFFQLLDKYWKHCDLKIIFNSEQKEYAYGSFYIERPTGNNIDASWSQRILNSLNSVNTPYVIMMLDDFWIKAPIDTEELGRCIRLMENDRRIKCINFAPQPSPNKRYKNETRYEKRGRFAPYRINAQIALWRVDYLKKIMRSYETPWQFELSGSFRSMIKGGILLAIKRGQPSVFAYDYGFLIVRGMINMKLAEYFQKKEGIFTGFPLPKYNVKAYYDNKHGRKRRILGYVKDAVISLFGK